MLFCIHLHLCEVHGLLGYSYDGSTNILPRTLTPLVCINAFVDITVIFYVILALIKNTHTE